MASLGRVPDPIYVLIADDHVVVRAGLKMLIESRPNMEVVGEAGTKAEVFEITGREKPDIILLDLHLGNDNALDFLPELLDKAGEARVIIITGFHDREEHQRAVRIGAMGVVLKETTPQLLLKSIEKVHEGEIWLDRFLTANLIIDLRDNHIPNKVEEKEDITTKLTEREHEIIALVGEGLRNKQIADRLCISETTVRHHLTSIFKKLEVCDRLELIVLAFRKGIIKVPA